MSIEPTANPRITLAYLLKQDGDDDLYNCLQLIFTEVINSNCWFDKEHYAEVVIVDRISSLKSSLIDDYCRHVLVDFSDNEVAEILNELESGTISIHSYTKLNAAHILSAEKTKERFLVHINEQRTAIVSALTKMNQLI
jgi:hypothetical protein